jgi:LmbE family N-acetylglucosaminyl deacetylase
MQSTLRTEGKVLVVAPHADDAELGAGGSIRRWVEEGRQVHILNMSDTSSVNGSKYGADLRNEARAAAAALGVERDNVSFANFPLRHFDSNRQAILDFLVELNNDLSPEIVIGPSFGDVHQDHSVVAKEIQRAFKKTTVLGFDTYWNMNVQKVDYVNELTQGQMRAKITALAAYKSQAQRPYMQSEVIMGLAKVRGLPKGFQFAEAFSVAQLVNPNGVKSTND